MSITNFIDFITGEDDDNTIVTISFKTTKRDRKILEKLVEYGYFMSISEAIRYAIKFLVRNIDKLRREVWGSELG